MPPAARLLFVNDPGIPATPFLQDAARTHLEAGRHVVYVVTERPPSSVERTMARRFPLEGLSGKLHVVDAYSPLLGLREPGRWTVPQPSDLLSWANTLSAAADHHPDAVLLIESLSSVADQIGYARFLDGLRELDVVWPRYQLSAASFTHWPYGEDLTGLYDRFHGVVRVQAVQERIVLSQSFSVERATWLPGHDVRPRLFRDVDRQGVVVYIPKIVVTGPYNAGKSTFVQTVCDHATSADRLGTTVALDHGSVHLDGLQAEVYGTPGQSRFDPILKLIANQALGVVVVVDSTRPASFPRARAMMDTVWRHGLPVVVAANKQDEPGALDVDAVTRLLDLPPYVQVVACTATDAQSARSVLHRLIDQIMSPQFGGSMPAPIEGVAP